MVPAPARLTVDLDALAANWRTLAAASGVATGAAVKADAYGLGVGPVARRLVAVGCRDLFVATWGEALALGEVGAAVHVFHGVAPDDLPAARALPWARPVLNTPDEARLWRDAFGARACGVMVDTGMNRLGLAPDELVAMDGFAVDILMSHLSSADEPGAADNPRQRDAFAAVPVACRRRSLAASAGIALGAAFAFDLTRPGLALYGGHASPLAPPMRAVVHVEARVLRLRDVAPGESVGYNATWTATRPTRLAVVSAGYADGVPRAPGGLARVDGVPCPIVGRVSMDLTAIDVTGAPPLSVGDWVALGPDLPALAAATGRSQYELLTGLGHRFERRYA